jgi:hypothetical protein
MSTNNLSDFDSDSDFNPDAKSEFELPSLEEIEEMEKQRCQAIESLEISYSADSVKYQKCGMAVPIVGKLTRTHNDRIAILQRTIKC